MPEYTTLYRLESEETIGFFGILLSVQIEAFLWGMGTAIGELPPYFVAKKVLPLPPSGFRNQG